MAFLDPSDPTVTSSVAFGHSVVNQEQDYRARSKMIRPIGLGRVLWLRGCGRLYDWGLGDIGLPRGLMSSIVMSLVLMTWGVLRFF